MKKKRAPGLIAIVFYKTFVASLLAFTSIALLLALKNHQFLQDFSDIYLLETKFKLVELLLEKILNFKQKTLLFSGIAAGIYAAITAVEAIGLWSEKSWARILVLVLVGISIPPEIFELIRGITLVKSVVFLGNVAVFWYLLYFFPKHNNEI
ncbi:MAG TPA: DUF2127 domain-containing protein [Kamptonema sp.]|nr:DUF2127 domain-containing protein [Kamptonema sp.]